MKSTNAFSTTTICLSLLLLTACSDNDSSNNSTPDIDAPIITAVYPDNGRDIGTAQVLIRGYIDEPSLTSVTIESAGNTTEADFEQGVFTVTINAAPGTNNFLVTATDTAGNQTEHQGSFYFGERSAAGGAHSGAIVGGKTYVWGRNNKGQLGLGLTSSLDDNETTPGTHPNAPVELTTATEFVSLAFNQNASLALDVNGEVWAWGDGDDGQLGLGANDEELDEDDRLTPEKIAGLSNIVSVVRGYDHSMALASDGSVWTFGDNSAGQLGDGTTEDRDYPIQLSLSNVIQISAGSKTSYALDSQGNLWAWGRNRYGNLGLGHELEEEVNYTPVQVPLDASVISIATGRDHILALTNTGEVFAWGLNASSQVGLHESEQWEGEIHSPTLLPWFTVDEPESLAQAVAANGNQSFVERSNGKVYPWGQNMLGTLGVEADGNVEAPDSALFGLENVRSFGIGALHGVSLRQDNQLFAWGWSFEGSLGGGESTIDRWGYRIPVLVTLPTEE